MTERFREEVLNVTLARLLDRRGLVTVPETIRTSGEDRRLPDVVLGEYRGIRIIIEGRINDDPSVRKSLESDAKRRIEEGLTAVCVAVLYPEHLRSSTFQELESDMTESKLEIKVFTESGEEPWVNGSVDILGQLLPLTYDTLVREDVITQAVAVLDQAIEQATSGILESRASPAKIAKVLGIPIARRISRGNESEETTRIVRIAALTLGNAMLFQEVLAAIIAEVPSIRTTLESSEPVKELVSTWNHILDEIDYIPIFRVAKDILICLPSGPGFTKAMRILGAASLTIASNRAALRHDLMGRIYHLLLAEPKYFGACYTSVPAATMLLKLALQNGSSVDWSSLEAVKSFRIVDLACGTGTLLKAALQTCSDNHIRESVSKEQKLNLPALHKILIENVLYGYDVLPFATHLAASALAMHEPDVPFGRMRLYSLPLRGAIGASPERLGSLDFLANREIHVQVDLFGERLGEEAQQVTGGGNREVSVILPEMDLCVMNPPFTRSVGGNLLFGSMPESERKGMQKRLGQLVKEHQFQANVTAGLGSVFVALADRNLKSEGCLALVLPKALLSGEAWGPTRSLITSKYRINHIVTSHDPEGWNFSENTQLSEALVVAKKTRRNESDAIFANLWRKPKTSIEAQTLVELLYVAKSPRLKESSGVCSLMIGNTKFGEVISVPQSELKEDSWMTGASFAQTEMARISRYLHDGELYVPGTGVVGTIKLTSLSKLASVGPDRRDIADGFNPTDTESVYKAFWGHDADSVKCIEQQANRYLEPLVVAKPGRNLRDANLLWSRSGELMIAERLWLNTQRATAVVMKTRALSNVWWPVQPNPIGSITSSSVAKIIGMWSNSTMGIMMLVATRVETRGPWIELKKPALQGMSVLDVRKLTKRQIKLIETGYDNIRNQELKPFPELRNDSTRRGIDDVMEEALGLPSLNTIRELLSKEPIISNVRLTSSTST